jgi:hypothetical protein
MITLCLYAYEEPCQCIDLLTKFSGNVMTALQTALQVTLQSSVISHKDIHALYLDISSHILCCAVLSCHSG